LKVQVAPPVAAMFEAPSGTGHTDQTLDGAALMILSRYCA
jgi:hypothetical protein